MLHAPSHSRVLPAAPTGASRAAAVRLRGRRAVITAVAEKDKGVGERTGRQRLPKQRSWLPGCSGTLDLLPGTGSTCCSRASGLALVSVSPPPLPPASLPPRRPCGQPPPSAASNRPPLHCTLP